MIIVKAPLRISFVGGGTDLPDFYKKSPGRVLSTAINQYVFVVINPTPLMRKVSARYATAETVDHPSDLQHNLIREALLDTGIHSNIEVGYFAHLPVKTGLGSSSSISVALMKGLNAYNGKKIDKREAAEAACRLEIERIKSPIGKQDQYTAAFGGCNILQFNQDDSVDVDPVLVDYKTRLDFEKHLLVFFTGVTRTAASVLTEQKANTANKFETLKQMADSVYEFRDRLIARDFQGLGGMLHAGWERKKTLASSVSNPLIDEFYAGGMSAGAWGGKVLGAGGGGCMLFLARPKTHGAIREAVKNVAKKHTLEDFQEIPIQFVQSGVEIVFNGSPSRILLS